MKLFSGYYKSTLGLIEIKATDLGISEIIFSAEDNLNPLTVIEENVEVKKATNQLDEYFTGNRREFDLKFDLAGTDFQLKVWNELLRIPYGATISYLQLANRLGSDKLTRAVGLANGKNPAAIVIPCHRVIGANGDLVGYAGGIWRKQWLLEHEGIQKRLF